MKILEVMEKIKIESKEKNTTELRVIKSHTVGKAIRQGDIYIHMVVADFPIGEIINTKQVVDGNSIGSRHILDKDVIVYEGKELPKWVNIRWPLGKSFDVKNRSIVTHPEHAHISLPKGRYVVTHQMDMRSMQKVSD